MNQELKHFIQYCKNNPSKTDIYIADELASNPSFTNEDAKEVRNSVAKALIKPVAKPSCWGDDDEDEKVVLVRLSDFAPPEFICKGLKIQKKWVTLLCGTGSSSKTLFAQHLALSIATGSKFLNEHECEKGKVYHIDMEQGIEQNRKRYCRLGEGMGLNIGEIPIKPKKLHNRIDSENLDAVQDYLIDMLPAKGYSTLLIDSFKAISSCDENSSTEVSPIMMMLKNVAEKANVAVILIHHMGKNVSESTKQKGRGSSAIFDSVDLAYDLTQTKGICKVQCAKMRDGRPIETFQYQLVDGAEFDLAHDLSYSLSLCMVNDNYEEPEKSVRDLVFEALTTPMTSNEVSRAVGKSKQATLDALQSLEKIQKIFSFEDGRKKMYKMVGGK